MHVCKNCGTQFEGNFCPECGKKYEECICPNCGKKFEEGVKFCNDCGFSFEVKEKNRLDKKAKRKEEGTDNGKISLNPQTLKKIYPYLEFIPNILFCLFSILIFVFYAAPVAVIPSQEIFGEVIEAESYGNVYSLYSGILSEIPELKGAMLALIIFACFTSLVSVFAIASRFLPPLKHKKLYKFSVCDLFAYSSAIFYFIFFVISCVIIGKVNSFDEGAGLIASGACPALILSFSLIFLIISSCSVAAKILILKKLPAVAEKVKQKEEEECEKYYEALRGRKEQKQKEIESLREPAFPEKIEKPVRPLKKEDNFIAFKRVALMSAFLPIVCPIFSFSSIGLASAHYLTYENGLYLFYGLTLFYLLFLIPLRIFCKKARNISQKKLCSKGSFNFSIIMGTLFIPASIYYLMVVFNLLYSVKDQFNFTLIYSMYVLLIGFGVIFPIVIGAVGLGKANAMRVKIFGTEKVKKDTRLTEYGEQFAVERDLFSENYAAYLQNKKAYAKYKVDCKAYKLEKSLYEKQKNYTKIPRPAKWLYANKVLMSLASVFIAVIILIICIVVPISNNIFRANKVNKIEYGFTRVEVESILGEPNYYGYYVSDNYKNLIAEFDRIRDELGTASDEGDTERLEKLNKDLDKIVEELCAITYKSISISYDSEMCVTGVSLNTQCHFYEDTETKFYEKIELKGRYSYSNGSVVAQIYYKDGSYKMCDVTYLLKEKNDISYGNKYYIHWQDGWGEYGVYYTHSYY